VLAAFTEESPRPVLLHGVTGSGKTEIYLRAVAACLEKGRGALYLVPEIGLTPLLARLIRSRFSDQVAVLHSALSAGERRAEWHRLQSGQARVALGPRSAVFAPVRDLGLVVVDEEQDPSYKQEESPRYNGRDLALVRARQRGSVVILGTATPSLETWRNARTGKYHLLELPERIGSRPLPRVELVDLREELRETGEVRVLSRRLVTALRERLSRGEQAIVLINRRGYAPFILCRSCGQTVGCKSCSVSLVLHGTAGGEESLRCHYCGARRRRPVLCPACRSEHLQPVGEGTERVEKHLRRELPGVCLERMDSDTVRGRAAHERILTAFERGEISLLVGTQMVAKGHDFPGVTLVGVLLADGVLGMPDFRAAERTWQLLTQVAGRAGRGDAPGEVIIQAVRPDHYAIAAAAAHDAIEFYDKELRIRRLMRAPPFTYLAQVLARASTLERAADAAARAARAIRAHGGGRVQVLGPAAAPIARLRGSYRVQLFARATSRRRLGAALGAMLAEAEHERFDRYLTVDVDPLTLL
jgi:primosomal protein N' (replication factor Y)